MSFPLTHLIILCMDLLADWLAFRIENEDDRLRGAHMWVVGIVFSICSLLGVVGSGLALVDLFSH